MPYKNLDKALLFRPTSYFVWKFEDFDELQLSYGSIFPWIIFLEIIEICLNLGIGFYITWLVLPNYKKISLSKPILD